MLSNAPKLFAAALLASLTLFASVDLFAQETDEEEAPVFYKTKEGLDFEFRSFSLGVGLANFSDPNDYNVVVETDFYLNWQWAIGGHFSVKDYVRLEYHEVGQRETRGSIYVDRLWGARMGQVSLRTGPFVNYYRRSFVQDPNYFDDEYYPLAYSDAYIVGAQLGATATFTPTRWAGLTVSAVAFPGYFLSTDFDCTAPGCERPDNFKVTGMLSMALRFGDLDGPDAKRDTTRSTKGRPEPTSDVAPE